MSTKIEDNTNSGTEEAFLNELKSHFEKVIDLRKNLDSKANTMITIASSLITINIAIGTFLISRIMITAGNSPFFYYFPIGVLAGGVTLALISIRMFIQSYSIKDYDYPWGTDYFFVEGKYKQERVDNVRKLPEKDFNDRLFRGYLRSIKSAEMNNDSKGESIKKGQKFLTYALIAIVALVILVLVFTGTGVVNLSGNQLP